MCMNLSQILAFITSSNESTHHTSTGRNTDHVMETFFVRRVSRADGARPLGGLGGRGL